MTDMEITPTIVRKYIYICTIIAESSPYDEMDGPWTCEYCLTTQRSTKWRGMAYLCISCYRPIWDKEL